MVAFAGRIESRIKVPTGGAAVSASNSGGGATTVTTPAGNYYWTAAGGVSSLITEFQSQLDSSRAPASGSWTVSLSTSTGLVSIGCTGSTAIPSFSLDWTDTTLRDVFGFTKNINYPTTAAEVASAIGYGTWTSGNGWLCNESSGNLAPVFGAATLTASGTPTYSNQGPRGGPDKAVGFDATTEYFDGGAISDASGTDDLIVAWVGKFSGLPSTTTAFLSKVNAGLTTGWAIFGNTTPILALYLTGNANSINITGAGAFHVGEWHVGIACIDRSTGKARIGTRGLTDLTSQVSAEFTTGSTSHASAATFRVGASAWVATNTSFQVSALYTVSGAGVATGLSANLSTALSNFAATFGTWTGTAQVQGMWFPDCPLNLDGDPEQAPKISDLRTSQSPTGVVLGLCGNTFYRHTGLVYTHVPRAQVWDSAATYENGSFEEWFAETQMGQGSTWFTPASPIQVYLHDGTRLGSAQNITGWTITGLDRVEPRKATGQWTGLFRIELGTLVTSA